LLKSIKKLKNTQRGECLIIGGGTSVNEINFTSLLPMKKIAVNRYHLKHTVDYQIHTDKYFSEWLERNPIPEETILIGLESHATKRTDYFFNWNIITEGFHTGFYALQIAEYLGFREIYLVGYDYYAKGERIYYFDSEPDFEITEVEKDMMLSVFDSKRLQDDFDKIDWKAKIYNCNPKSELKKFPIKLL